MGTATEGDGRGGGVAIPYPEQLEENAQRGLAFLARWKKEHGYAFA